MSRTTYVQSLAIMNPDVVEAYTYRRDGAVAGFRLYERPNKRL